MLSIFSQLHCLVEIDGVRRFLRVDPSISGWLLLPGLTVAAAMIFFLYRAQRRIASRRVVSALTSIRLALIALTFVLLTRPLWIWRQTRRDPPALWLVIDRSLSMAQRDEQSSPIERLRWADALGLLPVESHREKIDRVAASLSTMRDDLANLRRRPAQSTGIATDADRDASAAAIKPWSARLDALIEQLAMGNSASPIEGSALVVEMRSAEKSAREAADGAAWQRATAALDNAIAQAQRIADNADSAFLRDHANNAGISDAMARVAKLRRADFVSRVLNAASVHDLLAGHRLRMIAFGTDAKQIDSAGDATIEETIKAAAEPIDAATDLAGALRFVGAQIDENEPGTSILVLSDGQANAGGDPADAVRQLATRGIHVFTAAIGSRQLVPDAAIESLDAPDWIYKDDTARITASVRLDALVGKPAHVEFRRGQTLIDQQTVIATAAHVLQGLAFTDKPPEPGVYEYQVSIAPVADESVLDNNSRSVRVAVKKDKLEVLVIEDQPRWEYRYLANYLKRDSRVHLQTILLEPAQVDRIAPPKPVKASAANPNEEAQMLPRSAAEWSAFDLVVVGDVPPEFFTAEAQTNLAKAIRDRGTMLVAIAGPLNMPARFAGGPMAEILPVEPASNWSGGELADHLHNGFGIAIAPEGAASILSQFGSDRAYNATLWSAVPKWYWHSEQTQVKPGASVLWQISEKASAVETSKDIADSLALARRRALLATMPMGLGRVVYLASDSTWRLREVAGENVHERFWGQLIRWAAASDMPAGGKFVRFGVDKTRAVAGDPVQISARLLSQDYAPLVGQKLAAVIRAAGQPVAQVQMEDSSNTPGLYRAQIQNLPAGSFELALESPAIEKLMADDPTVVQRTFPFDILAPSSVEHQNVNSDRAALARVAREGNGLAVDAENLDLLADYVPRSPYEQTITRQLGMFADPNDRFTRLAHWGFLALFVALITLEWVLRKMAGLV